MGIANTILTIAIAPHITQSTLPIWIPIILGLYLVAIGLYIYGYKWGKAETKELISSIPEVLSGMKARRIQIAQDTSSKMPDVLDIENTEHTWIDALMGYWAIHTGKTKEQLAKECLSSNNFIGHLIEEITSGIKQVNENILKLGKENSDEEINVFTEKNLALETKVNNDKQYIKLKNKLDKAKKQPKITSGLMGAINDYISGIITYTSYFVMTTQYLSMVDMFESVAPEELKPAIARHAMPACKWKKIADRQLDDKLAQVSEEINKIQW